MSPFFTKLRSAEATAVPLRLTLKHTVSFVPIYPHHVSAWGTVSSGSWRRRSFCLDVFLNPKAQDNNTEDSQSAEPKTEPSFLNKYQWKITTIKQNKTYKQKTEAGGEKRSVMDLVVISQLETHTSKSVCSGVPEVRRLSQIKKHTKPFMSR